MANETKLLLGKILGEIYRLQNAANVQNGVSEQHVYGLLHGFEREIDGELESIGFISNQKLNFVSELLSEYFYNEEKLNQLKGFYDIESELLKNGVSRSDAIKIFTFFHANGQFTSVLEKIDSTNSPAELTGGFEIDKYSK